MCSLHWLHINMIQDQNVNCYSHACMQSCRNINCQTTMQYYSETMLQTHILALILDSSFYACTLNSSFKSYSYSYIHLIYTWFMSNTCLRLNLSTHLIVSCDTTFFGYCCGAENLEECAYSISTQYISICLICTRYSQFSHLCL